jgi:WD40 repeat protein
MRTCLRCLILVGMSFLTAFQATAAEPWSIVGGPRAVQNKAQRSDLYGDPLPDGAIARLGSLCLRDPGGSQRVVVSTDGTLLASSSLEPKIALWDLPSGKARLRLDVGSNMNALAFSPNGKVLVSASDALCFWDTTTGKQLFKIDNDNQRITDLAFSPDGRLLASCGKRPGVCLWDAATGSLVRSLAGDDKGQVVEKVAFAPDGTAVASAGRDRTARVWEVATGKEIRRHTATADCYAVAFTRDGRALALGGFDGYISLYDRDTGKQRWRIDANPTRAPIEALAFSPDGAVLACSALFSTVRLWNTATGEECRESATIPEWGLQAAWLPKGRVLVLWGSGNVIRLWDTVAAKDIRVAEGHLGSVAAAAFAPDGKTIASASYDGTIRLWEANTGRELSSWTGHEEKSVTGIAFLPDGKTIVSVGWNGQVRRWETKTGKLLARFVAADRSVRRLALAADGRSLFAGGLFLAQHWDFGSGQILRQFGSLPKDRFEDPIQDPKVRITGLTASPDGKLLVMTTLGGLVRFWNVATGKERPAPLGLAKVGLVPVVLSPNGRVFAADHTYSFDGISVWESATFRQRCQLHVDKQVRYLAFAPGGRLLACADDSGKVLLVDIATGDTVGRLNSPGSIECLAFAPDGRRLVTGRIDGTLLVWDLPEAPRKLVSTSLRSVWAALTGADAEQAHRAIWALVESPGAVPFLCQRLRPASVAAEVAGWVADLDNATYGKRQAAMTGLEKLGNSAEVALQGVLAGKPSLEARRRAEMLLGKLKEVPLSADDLRELRAVEVLEYIGTAEAQQLLETLTRGAPGARLTQEARAALDRLRARRI